MESSLITRLGDFSEANVKSYVSAGRYEELKELILGFINRDPDCVSNIIGTTINAYMSQDECAELYNLILSIIKKNIGRWDKIVKPIIIKATDIYLSKGKYAEFQELVLKLLKNRMDTRFMVAQAVIDGCIPENSENKFQELQLFILQLIQNNESEAAHYIMTPLLESRNPNNNEVAFSIIMELLKARNLESEGIESDPSISNSVQKFVSEFIKRIYFGFKHHDYTLETFNRLVLCIIINNVGTEETKEMKSIFSLFLSEYFIDVLINGAERNKDREEKLFYMYYCLYMFPDPTSYQCPNFTICPVRDIETYTTTVVDGTEQTTDTGDKNFGSIKIEDLLTLSDTCLKTRFKHIGTNGGSLEETFLKCICEVMKGRVTNVKELCNHRDLLLLLFKNFRTATIDTRSYTLSLEDFFRTINLTTTDFGKKEVTIVNLHTVDAGVNHYAVMVIDTTKPWSEAIKGKKGVIKMIDSDRSVLSKMEIFGKAQHLNRVCYQDDGRSSGFHAAAASAVLLQLQLEAKNQGKNLIMDDLDKESKGPGTRGLYKLDDRIISFLEDNFFALTPACQEMRRNLMLSLPENHKDAIVKPEYLKIVQMGIIHRRLRDARKDVTTRTERTPLLS